MRPAISLKHCSTFCRKASLTPGKLLPQAPEEAAQVALPAILFLRGLEEIAHPLERRAAPLAEEAVERGVDLLEIQVDHLQAEVFLRLEVVIEGTLGDVRRLEQRGDAQVVIAVAQQHAHALLEKLVARVVGHREPIRPVGLGKIALPRMGVKRRSWALQGRTAAGDPPGRVHLPRQGWLLGGTPAFRRRRANPGRARACRPRPLPRKTRRCGLPSARRHDRLRDDP